MVTYIKALLFDRTQHVLAAQTVTKAEFRSSQTHEFEAIQKIIPVVQAKGIYSCTICRGSLCTSSLLTYTVISFRTQCGRSGTRLCAKNKKLAFTAEHTKFF